MNKRPMQWRHRKLPFEKFKKFTSNSCSLYIQITVRKYQWIRCTVLSPFTMSAKICLDYNHLAAIWSEKDCSKIVRFLQSFRLMFFTLLDPWPIHVINCLFQFHTFHLFSSFKSFLLFFSFVNVFASLSVNLNAPWIFLSLESRSAQKLFLKFFIIFYFWTTPYFFAFGVRCNWEKFSTSKLKL
jgi:hypothetical protein